MNMQQIPPRHPDEPKIRVYLSATEIRWLRKSITVELRLIKLEHCAPERHPLKALDNRLQAHFLELEQWAKDETPF